MTYLSVLSIIFLLFWHAFGVVTTEQMPMDRVGHPDGLPTYQLGPIHVEGSGFSADANGALDVAHMCYNWVKEQPGVRNADWYDPRKELVAVMYEPVTQTFWASTKPKGSRWKMLRDYRDKAPAWYAVLNDDMRTSSEPTFHAEDNNWFIFETFPWRPNPIQNGKYPTGTVMKVWGKWPKESLNVPDRPLSLCSTIGRKTKTCQAMATELNVQFANLPPPAPEEDFFEGIADEELLELDQACENPSKVKGQEIRGRGLMVRRKGTTSCSDPPFSIPASAPISTVTISLPSSGSGPITSAPSPDSTPSCSMHMQDPDEGINSAFCVCESTTLPLLSVASATAITDSCHYTSIPKTPPITPTTTFGRAQTDSKLCRVCDPLPNFGASCTTLPNCIAQTGAATVEAGSSPVHVGTLTGTALYTSVSSALNKLCPKVTQTTAMTHCSTGTVKIRNVPYVHEGELAQGVLAVSVENSSYNVTSLRDAMIKSAALTAQNAATGKNCYNQTFEMPEVHPVPEHHVWCNTVQFAGVQYFGPYARLQAEPGPTDFLDAHWQFETGANGDFECQLLMALADAFAVVAPEFAVADVELGEAIDVMCEQSEK